MSGFQSSEDKNAKISSGKLVWYIIGGASLVFTFFSILAFFIMWLPMKQYISEEAWPIEYIEESEEKEKEVWNKFNRFFTDSTLSADTLTLNEEEVNHLLRTNKALQNYGVQYRISLGDSLLNAKCTVPARVIKNQMVSLVRFVNIDGHVNAELEGYVRIQEQKLMFITTNSQMNGYPAPFALLGNRTHVDVSNYFANRFEYNKKRAQLEKVYIKNGNLYFVKKAKVE